MTAPTKPAAGGSDVPGLPAAAHTAQHVSAALFVDLEGVRARYECLLCQTVEGPVFGPEDVTAFVASIRTTHRVRCAASRENRS